MTKHIKVPEGFVIPRRIEINPDDMPPPESPIYRRDRGQPQNEVGIPLHKEAPQLPPPGWVPDRENGGWKYDPKQDPRNRGYGDEDRGYGEPDSDGYGDGERGVCIIQM